MKRLLLTLANSPWYWLFLIVLGLGMEGIALYYQYALDYGPCVLCIHVRLWITVMILIAVLALLRPRLKWFNVMSHLLMCGVMLALVNRSWLLIATERGWIEGTCDFNIGLPAWLDVQKWWPFLYEIQEPCGYTPILYFGVTMAEALLVIFSVLTVISLVLFVTALFSGRTAD